MKKMTLTVALSICANLWDWLADHPTEKKDAWPGWETVVADYGQPRLYCPCCHYVMQERVLEGRMLDCSGGVCPMASTWGPITSIDFGCEQPGSPYHKWHTVELDSPWRAYYARVIRDAAIALLKPEEA